MITFTIKAPPFSVNKAYYRNRQLTQEARQWRSEFLLQLQQEDILSKLREVRKEFQPKLHGISVEYVFFYPYKLLYTKKGEVSKRSNDLTNIEKLVQDNIFDSRFNGRVIEDITIENLDIDDKYIISLQSKKLPLPDLLEDQDHHLIEISFSLISLPQAQA